MNTLFLLFVLFGLLVFSKGLIPALLTGGDSASVSVADGLPMYQALAAAIYGLTAVYALTRPRTIAREAAGAPMVWLLCAWATASVAWSVAPEVTLRRSAAIIGTTLFAMVLVARRDESVIRKPLEWLLAGFLVLSVAAAIWMPSFGLHAGLHDGSWRGVFLHKNTLAQFMSLGVALFLSEALDRPEGRAVRVALAVGCAAVLAATGSRTAWLVTPLVVVILSVLRVRLRVAAAAVVAAAVLLAATGGWGVGAGDVFSAVGRDESLTGRLPLWNSILDDVAGRPALGYGYGAYWLGKVGTSAATWGALGWGDSPKHAHNAVLDVLVELGTVGAVLLIVHVLWVTGAVLWAARRRLVPRWQASAALTVTLFGLTGGEVFVQNSLYWVLYVAVSASATAAWVAHCRQTREPAPMRPTVRMRPAAVESQPSGV